SQGPPPITWATPSRITYGTALSAIQLSATSTVVGTFVYTPAAGTVPTVGTATLSVAFTPTGTVDYAPVTKTVSLIVSQDTPVVTWTPPASITYGTALSNMQLNATASVPGSFAYTPAVGNVPTAGTHVLSVTFTPTDTTNYTTVTQTVQLTVNKAAPVVTWTPPAAITYGTALSGTQLNATASVPGTFAYSPVAGVVLNPGNQTLSVTFNPTDTANYTIAAQTVSLTINKATASVPGNFVYSPAAGVVLGAGTQTLSVTFTPTDTTNYKSVTQTAQIVVNQATLTVTSANASRIYNTANPTFTGAVTGAVNG